MKVETNFDVGQEVWAIYQGCIGGKWVWLTDRKPREIIAKGDFILLQNWCGKWFFSGEIFLTREEADAECQRRNNE